MDTCCVPRHRLYHPLRALVLALLLALPQLLARLGAAEERLLCDFENPAELAIFEMKSGTLSDLHPTHGTHSLKILPGEYLSSWRLPHDWSGYDALDLDAFVDGDEPLTGTILVGDQAWKDKGSTYWNRANRTFTLKPGANVISIPVQGLYRGEAGSRGNDLTTAIDPTAIIRLDYGFDAKAAVRAIYLDALRLTRSARPPGILAFKFGPSDQSSFPGFAPISWDTVYGANGAKAGLRERCYGPNRARDDTYPTRLFGNYLWFEEDHNEFIVDVPPGKCQVWMVFDDCGYWGGEQAQFRIRTVSANGKEAWREDRGELGRADYLFRFEALEPKPTDSMWDLYVKDLFTPLRFAVDQASGPLRIACSADGPWSTKLAAMIIYKDSESAAAERFISGVMAANRSEFAARAVFLGPRPKALAVPPGAQAQGWWLGVPGLDDEVASVDAPGHPAAGLQAVGARGQLVSWTFAIRPLRDLAGEVTLRCSDLHGPAGTIPAAAVDVRYVHQLVRRGGSDLAYTIVPSSVRHLAGSGLLLGRDVTRQFWLSLAVDERAGAGSYAGTVTLSAGSTAISLPLTLEVLDCALDDPDFNFGFLGAWLPEALPRARLADAWFELGSLLKHMGMNSFCGGPNIGFQGLAADGRPALDFAGCDAYFTALARAGYTRPLYSYGGPAMVAGLDDIASCREWARKAGMPPEALLHLVWGAVEEHALARNWLPVYYGMLDEPRTVEQAKAGLALHQLYRAAAPMVRDGGFYSVDWRGSDALATTVQQLFATMSWSGLNEHTQADLDHAKAAAREVHIYNQGLDRYSFGAYQWAELRKGVKGRMQWHVLALSGYQFYDLDAREPDPGVINWGRHEIIPTLSAFRCAEGAYDLRYAATLWNLAQARHGERAAAEAISFLDGISASIPAGARTRPSTVPDGEAFRSACVAKLRALLGK
jgi:hypothetical protein